MTRFRRCRVGGSGVRMAALLAATAITLCGCGSAPSNSSTAPAAPATLEQSVGRLDRLVVTRTNAFPENHIRFAFPAKVSVTDPAAVQAVARALLALPEPPSGTVYGPIDLGITYHLVFFAGDRRFPVVNVNATGTETVTGLGPARSATGAATFWHALGVAVGVSRPSWDAFRGSV